jgi:hypothetical protein
MQVCFISSSNLQHVFMIVQVFVSIKKLDFDKLTKFLACTFIKLIIIFIIESLLHNLIPTKGQWKIIIECHYFPSPCNLEFYFKSKKYSLIHH